MHKLVAALIMAIIGALLFSAFVMQDIRIHPELGPQDLPWGLIIRYGVAMTLGGALAGYLLCGTFGRGGAGGWVLALLGWVLALLGGIIAASLSGLLGSAFGLLPDMLSDGFSLSEAIQIGAGLLVLPFAADEEPILIPAVVALIAATHILCKRLRNAD